MSRPSKTRSLLATLRIANAPSVVSNVLLGSLIGWYGVHGARLSDDTATIGGCRPGLLLLSALLLYFSGNLANDWYDREWDRTRRPERALPAGVFQPRTYLVAALLAAAAGAFLAFLESTAGGFCALAILLLIAIYTRFHKRASWAILPMGLCRAGLYFLGFLAFRPDSETSGTSTGNIVLISILAVGLTSYIAGLSLCARYESMADAPPGPKRLSRGLLLLPLLAMSCGWNPLHALAGMVPFGAWIAFCFTRLRRPIPRFVSGLLAGIPLVDLIAATPLALSLTLDHRRGVVDVPAALLIVSVPVVAFLLGRLLQRVAPAT